MDTEKSIKEIEAKTYAYMSSVLIGPLIINAFILINGFFYCLTEYLTYHNNAEDNGGELLFYVNPREIPIYGILSLIFILVLIILMRFYVRRIQCIEKKKTPLIISIGVMIVSALFLGYISIILLDLFIKTL